MRIVTFNINNIVARLAVLTAWLQAEQPDVVCLQELKADQGAFPLAALEALGYQAAWRGQRAWNGVAILARGMTPIVTRAALPGDPDKSQARYIEAAVNGVLVGRLCLPNGNPAPGPKFDDKLAWFERFIAYAQSLLATGAPVVLAGDYNVVPSEADIHPNHYYAGNALLRPESRAAFARLLDQGQGLAPGPPAAVAGPGRPSRRRRRRSLGARPGGRQRPCPRVDRAGSMSPPVTPNGRYFVVRVGSGDAVVPTWRPSGGKRSLTS